MSRKKLFAVNLLLACAGLGATFSVATLLMAKRMGGTKVRASGDPIIIYDKQIGFKANELSQSKRCHNDNQFCYTLLTNRYGSRVAENSSMMDRTRTYNSSDLAFIGCSFTWAHGIKQTDSYSHIVSTALNKRYQNMGMGSYGMLQSIQSLEKLPSKPDIVIYGYINDSLRRSKAECAPSYAPYCLGMSSLKRKDEVLYIQPPFGIDRFKLTTDFLETSSSPFLFKYIKAPYYTLQLLIDKLMYKPDPDNIPDEEAFAYLVNRLKKSAENKVYVVNLDISGNDKFFEKMSRKWSSTKLVFVNPLSKAGHKDLQELAIKNDGHPNEKANKLYASALIRAMSIKL